MTHKEIAKIAYDATAPAGDKFDNASIANKIHAVNMVEDFMAEPEKKPLSSRQEDFSFLTKELQQVDASDANKIAIILEEMKKPKGTKKVSAEAKEEKKAPVEKFIDKFKPKKNSKNK